MASVGHIAGVGVRIDDDEEAEVVVLDVVNEPLSEDERLLPHLGRQLA